MKSVLIVGDLHLSDKFRGQHKDYYVNCLEVMEMIEQKCISLAEKGDVYLIFLGDLFGVSEKRFTTRFFMIQVVEWFARLNDLCTEVMTVKGNHDISHSDLPDYEVLLRLGCFTNPEYFDWESLGSNSGIRFHFVNYGDEKRPLELHPEWGNIVLAHNDFGGHGGYQSEDTVVPVNELSHWADVNMVISGHIHTPSVDSWLTLPSHNATLPLIYVGCPTRVKERIDDVLTVVFETPIDDSSESSIGYSVDEFGLKPAAEEFIEKEDSVESGVTLDPEIERLRLESLKGIVGSLKQRDMNSTNLLQMIEARTDITDRVKKISIDLLTECLEG